MANIRRDQVDQQMLQNSGEIGYIWRRLSKIRYFATPRRNRALKIHLLFWIISASFLFGTASASEHDTVAAPKFANIQCVGSDGKPRQRNSLGPASICRIGDRVQTTVTGLGNWLEDETSKDNKLSNIVLALDGQMLTGLTAGQPAEYGDAATRVLFYLTHTDDNRSDWQKALVRSTFSEPKAMTLSIVQIGTIKTFGTAQILMSVTPFWPTGVMGIIYVCLLGGFLILVRQGKLLRDIGPAPKGGVRPYSLGAVQMAFWFFIILAGFIYVWMMTSALDSLTAGVLGLAGISAGTGLAATAIGASKMTEDAKKRFELESDRAHLADELKALKRIKPSEQDSKNIKKLTTRITEIETDLAPLPPGPKPARSQGFFSDLLTSEGHVTFSRFQMLAWTLVLGVIFIHAIYTTLAMPEFNATLLALMGMSSGTYVGFKFPQTPNG